MGLVQTLLSVEEALVPFREGLKFDQVPSDIKQLVDKFQSGFLVSMLDDLHTSSVLDDLMEPLKAMNNSLKKFKVVSLSPPPLPSFSSSPSPSLNRRLKFHHR